MMGLLDIFKTQWSGKNMTEEDRKKMFWYLKRKTSYTAWKREADAFDQFADVFEQEVKENEHSDYWSGSYPRILQAQVDYEKGLANLLSGDRTVWLYNERGFLRDAFSARAWWHEALTYREWAGDFSLDNCIHAKELQQAIQHVFNVGEDTGYVQPKMAGIRAPHFWGEWMKDELARVCRSGNFPDVPQAKTEVLLRTGTEVPVFGIYEPQTKDGCMNYLLAGTPAPPLNESGGIQSNVTWRLLWEDDRYLEGVIPAEEGDYFPPEATSAKPIDLQVDHDLISASSGTPCPKTGTWAVMDDLTGRLTITVGESMPQHKGRDVTWVWTAA